MEPVPSSEGFSDTQRYDIDRAIRAAETASRFEFSVYVGPCEGEPRAYAERLHGTLVAPDRSVLFMVDPQRQLIEVVTGAVVRRDLHDDRVKLAVVAMQAAFSQGDLVDGIERGLAQLADAARAPETLHTKEP